MHEHQPVFEKGSCRLKAVNPLFSFMLTCLLNFRISLWHQGFLIERPTVVTDGREVVFESPIYSPNSDMYDKIGFFPIVLPPTTTTHAPAPAAAVTGGAGAGGRAVLQANSNDNIGAISHPTLPIFRQFLTTSWTCKTLCCKNQRVFLFRQKKPAGTIPCKRRSALVCRPNYRALHHGSSCLNHLNLWGHNYTSAGQLQTKYKHMFNVNPNSLLLLSLKMLFCTKKKFVRNPDAFILLEGQPVQLVGFHVKGGVIVGSNVSERTCRRTCDQDEACRAVDYDSLNKLCWSHDSSSYCGTPYVQLGTSHFKKSSCKKGKANQRKTAGHLVDSVACDVAHFNFACSLCAVSWCQCGLRSHLFLNANSRIMQAQRKCSRRS